MTNPYRTNQYRQTAVTTANRGQVLLMLYEAAISNVKKASAALDKKDLKTKGVCIIKAHDIINELLNTLNFEIGGDIARELERLYNFMIGQLVSANMENKKEPLATVQNLLETLLEGWRGAVAEVNKGSANRSA
ncbi:flagellar export chaperone FliS [Bdellovibrionota bacterium FG-2]